MKFRLYALVGLVLVAIAFVLVVLTDRSPSSAARHGSFTHRFEPRAPGAVAKQDPARVAGVGSINDLRPVGITNR